MILSLKNPHSVLAALKLRPHDVLEVLLPASHRGRDEDSAWGQVEKLARQYRIQIRDKQAEKNQGSRFAADGGGRTALAEARVKEKPALVIEELFTKDSFQKKTGQGLWLALDQLHDPQNVGSIFRSAAFFGVQGIVMTQDRASSMTSVVYDVASGGVEAVPFVVHSNLQRAFEVAKEAGLWILGSSEHAKTSYKDIQKDRPWLLVLGNEEKGLRRLTQEACDELCAIPLTGAGQVSSLNVSVASGILISHLGCPTPF